MATRNWIGGTTARSQVWQATVTNAVNLDTYQIILTDEGGGTGNVSYTASVGADTTTSIATSLFNLVNNSSDPRFLAITATNPSNGVVVLTADNSGIPFYPSTGGTGGMTPLATTTNLGPNDFNTAANWAENAVPVGGDNVNISGFNALTYGVNTGLTFAAFNTLGSSSGAQGGLGKPFSFGCTSFSFSGTGQSYFNIGSSNIPVTVYQTASATAPSSGLYLLGTNITTLTVYGGSVDIAGTVGQTSTVATTVVSSFNNNTARVNFGSGASITTVGVDSGTATIGCALTTLNANGGNVNTIGTGAITTLTNNGCTVVNNSSGTITNLNINGGSNDFTQNTVPRTVTNCTFNVGKSAQLLLDTAVVTLTNKVVINSGTTTLTVQ